MTDECVRKYKSPKSANKVNKHSQIASLLHAKLTETLASRDTKIEEMVMSGWPIKSHSEFDGKVESSVSVQQR
jgi:hypothetical protein